MKSVKSLPVYLNYENLTPALEVTFERLIPEIIKSWTIIITNKPQITNVSYIFTFRYIGQDKLEPQSPMLYKLKEIDFFGSVSNNNTFQYKFENDFSKTLTIFPFVTKTEVGEFMALSKEYVSNILNSLMDVHIPTYVHTQIRQEMYNRQRG